MKNTTSAVVLIASLGLLLGAGYQGPLDSNTKAGTLASAALDAISQDSAVSVAAIQTLRAKGQEGFQALLDTHADMIKLHAVGAIPAATPADTAAWERLRAALDAVSGQRDCHASQLYWHTDMEQAKAAAKSTGKPILSLRLLGRLDEEYSCANSRFFRTTLYANAKVSQFLRDNFVLHWQSVRPVPRITIDFGDGRKIERTVTGNSIHYVLDANGRPVDALPGLYGPKAFLKGLTNARQAAVAFMALAADSQSTFLREYHTGRIKAINAAFDSDMAALGLQAIAVVDVPMVSPAPTALAAGTIARGKGKVETPMLKSFQDTNAPATSSASPPVAIEAGRTFVTKYDVEMPMLRSFQNVDDPTWSRIAALHQEDAVLDAGAMQLIRTKFPTARDAGRPSPSKKFVEDPLISTMRNLQRSIAEDTVRNEYQLHARIHEWFVRGTVPADLGKLNSRVYAELFLTPDSDPWLGLVPANTFTGLDNNGLVQTSK